MDRISEILSSLVNNESVSSGRYSRYDLSNIQKLLSLSGNPQSHGTYIHIAGTNGKGSVAWMLAKILESRGIPTGLYTSPHLLTLNERIRINSQPIPNHTLEGYLDQLKSYMDSTGITPTWFDAITWAALCYFRDMKADITIMETGLGGRLDSTNVITPAVTILTQISMDHMGVLGYTLKDIASEKAGIIKNGIPVISSRGSNEVLQVITSYASDAKAPLVQEGIHFQVTNIRASTDGIIFNYTCDSPVTGCIDISDIFLPVNCRVHARNAGFAVTAACILDRIIRKDLAGNVSRALKSISIPGRFEKLRDDPPVIFDPAHNPTAVNEVLRSMFANYTGYPISVVLSLMKDKDYTGILSILEKFAFANIFYHVLDDQRCYRPSDEDQQKLQCMIITHARETLFQSLQLIRSAGTIILFLGSFRLYKTAKEFAMTK
ncbi:MAG: bifunctional folylpolyglutamate synthase/dihydrofolate synthase [Spirochaetota bacterium]